VVLTDKDAGRSVTVNVGTSIEVDISVTPPTTVEPATADDPTVLKRLSASSGLSDHSQAVFVAVGTGETRIIALTHPVCPSNQGCLAAAAYGFYITVSTA
jgi:hypothetical protein